VFLIFPHQFHHYLEIESDEINWLFITFELAKPELVQALLNSPRIVGAAEEELLQAMMKDYLSQAPAAERSFRVIVQVSEFLRRLLGTRTADAAVSRDDGAADPKGAILLSINRYVRAHINQPLTIADLARHTGYSISHLRAVFRKELGVSLGGYMRDSRLSLAAAMLTEENRGSIESIAKACGFVSIFAFSRAFKNAMGVSPRVYRKLVKDGSGKGGLQVVE
jgi:AraC-like DNA-binding protein